MKKISTETTNVEIMADFVDGAVMSVGVRWDVREGGKGEIRVTKSLVVIGMSELK